MQHLLHTHRFAIGLTLLAAAFGVVALALLVRHQAPSDGSVFGLTPPPEPAIPYSAHGLVVDKGSDTRRMRLRAEGESLPVSVSLSGISQETPTADLARNEPVALRYGPGMHGRDGKVRLPRDVLRSSHFRLTQRRIQDTGAQRGPRLPESRYRLVPDSASASGEK